MAAGTPYTSCTFGTRTLTLTRFWQRASLSSAKILVGGRPLVLDLLVGLAGAGWDTELASCIEGEQELSLTDVVCMAVRKLALQHSRSGC